MTAKWLLAARTLALASMLCLIGAQSTVGAEVPQAFIPQYAFVLFYTDAQGNVHTDISTPIDTLEECQSWASEKDLAYWHSIYPDFVSGTGQCFGPALVPLPHPAVDEPKTPEGHPKGSI